MTITEKYYPVIKDKVTGWMVEEKMEWFEKAYLLLRNEWHSQGISQKSELVSCELGVWYGMSAIAQGILIKQLGFPCKLHAVDAWASDACAEGTQEDSNRDWWNEQDYSKALQSFRKYVFDFDLNEVIEIWIQKSEQAATHIPNEIDLLHIDGNHSIEIVSKDIDLYLPKVRSGGYIFMDDTNWEGVDKSLGKLNEVCDLLHAYNKDGQSFNVYIKK